MASPQPSQQRPLSDDFETLSYVNGLVEAFKAFDSDSDGLITAEELRGIMASLGYSTSKSEAEEMVRRAGADRDGRLSIGEFLKMNTSESDLGSLPGQLQAAAAALGPDGVSAGAVTGEDLFKVLASASMDDCMEIIACLDGDGDGAVSLEDFKLVTNALL